MAETRVGARDQLGERVVGEGLADEGPHDAEGDLLRKAAPASAAMSPAPMRGTSAGT